MDFSDLLGLLSWGLPKLVNSHIRADFSVPSSRHCRRERVGITASLPQACSGLWGPSPLLCLLTQYFLHSFRHIAGVLSTPAFLRKLPSPESLRPPLDMKLCQHFFPMKFFLLLHSPQSPASFSSQGHDWIAVASSSWR